MANAGEIPAKVTEIVAGLAASRWASLAAILIVALVCFLPGFARIAPLDGDEPGYAVAAREMVETGDFASVRLQTDNAEWRPRGAYWIQALTIAFAGDNPPIWVHRLPSLTAAIAAALLTWWLAIAFGSPRAALLAGLFVAASGLVGLEARLATGDAILLAALTLAAGALARVWLSRDRHASDLVVGLFWAALGVGILVKGFVAPAIVIAALAVLSIERGNVRWLAGLRPEGGLALVFLVVSPSLIAITLSVLQGQGDGPSGEFLAQLGVRFQLQAPPGTYALLLPIIAGPAATFIFLSFRWFVSEYRRPPILFALAWGGPLWLAAELLPTKLPQFVLPAVPAVALLAATAIDAGASRIVGRVSWFFSLGPVAWPPILALVMPFVFFYFEGRIPVVATVAFAIAAVLGPITWSWLVRGEQVAAAAFAVVTTVFIYGGFFGAYVPGFSGIRIGERIATEATLSVPCVAPVFAAAGYPEESVVLALGRQTRIVDPWSAADFLTISGCRVAAVDSSQISSFRQRAEDLGLEVVERGRVTGFNLRKMRRVDVHLFTTAGVANLTGGR